MKLVYTLTATNRTTGKEEVFNVAPFPADADTFKKQVKHTKEETKIPKGSRYHQPETRELLESYLNESLTSIFVVSKPYLGWQPFSSQDELVGLVDLNE